MRRKSERTATKKAKASPEKKLEKVKRTRTRRGRKHSTSSENESEHEKTPVREVEEVVQTEKKPPSTPVKEDSPEETPDQVWQVKTAESSGDVGEIKKLKICLTRPPSTPERPERSPRSKRKHSRATSSSDTPSVEGAEEKKKSKHKSKRSMRESKEESDKNDSQGDETEIETQKPADEVSQSTDTEKPAVTDDTPMSTTNEEKTEENEKPEQNKSDVSDSNTANTDTDLQNKSSDADTTVVSPKHDDQDKTSEEVTDRKTNPEANEEKMEVLEIHADESRFESMESSRIDDDNSEERVVVKPGVEPSSPEGKVSITEENSASETTEAQQSANKHDVVESSENIDTRTFKDTDNNAGETKERYSNRELERSDSTQSIPEENHNGPSVPFVVNRKRRWGSRPSRVSSQKSITISTDVLKEIIPDVKPVEFEEVIEEKKHKRIEIPDRDKVDRPVLPKIVIDNTDGGDQNRKEENSVEENTKARESLGSNRKISIVIENDSIIARPPSPPRHKQSNILYITNLVRPFTLPQLKNLLQRTGRIVENGFWIDRIKSKCFVQYETEDQAIETRHALHGVTWPVSNPKTLQVDFSSSEAFDKAKQNEENDTTPVSTIPGTVEDWLREQDIKRERGEVEKPWERKAAMREWDMGKNEKDKEKDKLHRDDRSMERRRNRTSDRSPEPAKKFKKKEEEAPAKLLDDLFRKTKTTPCIYWLPLSAETIAVKEEQRRQHMAEHERRLQELRRTQHRRH